MFNFRRPLGRFLALASLLRFLLAGHNTEAFQFHKHQNPSTNFPPGTAKSDDKKTVLTDEMKILPQADSDSDSESESQPIHLVDVDLEKARDLATHSEKYSYGEIEHMRDDLHTHRMQNLALGHDEYSDDLLFYERILEDDLTSQLDDLQGETPNPYLFRYPDKESKSESNSESKSESKSATKRRVDTDAYADADPAPGPGVFRGGGASGSHDGDAVEQHKKKDYFDQLAEEGVVESLAICAILGFLMMAPGRIV